MGDYKEDDWITGEQSLGGKVALVRKNVSLSAVRRRDYPFELTIHLVYEDMQDDGLPGSREEVDLLGRNEEAVADHFCGRYNAQFALCVTSDGIRDQFLYLPAQMDEDGIASELDALALSVDYDFGIRKSPNWDIYNNALPEQETTAATSRLPWWKRIFGAS